MVEQGRLRRASRVISTGPGAGLVTWDTWRYARGRPRPRPGPLEEPLSVRGHRWVGRAASPSLLAPRPFPLLSPTPRVTPPSNAFLSLLAHPSEGASGAGLPTLAGGQAAPQGAAGAGTHTTVRMTAAVQPETCSWACGEHAIAGRQEYRVPYAHVFHAHFCSVLVFLQILSPFLTPTPAPREDGAGAQCMGGNTRVEVWVSSQYRAGSWLSPQSLAPDQTPEGTQ